MTDDRETASDPIRHFDAAAGLYADKHYGGRVRSFMTERLKRVLELVDGLGLPAGANVLDAGCGPGHLVLELAARGFRVAATDAAEGMLRIAEGRLAAADPPIAPTFEIGNIEALPYPDAHFDLVCSTGVIEYVPADEAALAEFRRVLRPGGHLVLSVTNAWSPVLWLDGGVELVKRHDAMRTSVNAVLRRAGRPPLLKRDFSIRLHRPRRFRRALTAAGFRLVDDVYFHFLPWPRPFDQLFPRVSAALGSPMERLGRSPLGILAEGYVTLSVKARA